MPNVEQQGGLLNSDALQAALNQLFSGAGGGGGGPIPGLDLLFLYSGYDEVIQPVVSGGADNAPILNSFLNPTVGQIIQANNIRARVKYAGNYTLKSLIDVDPQVTMDMQARGGIVFIPDPNLPGIVPGTPGTGVRTGGGGPAALFRIVRRAPDINKQAYEPRIGGFNLDATNINFVNPVSGIRIPNADPSKNANDPDQNFLTNKKYTGGCFVDMDVVGFSNDQIVIEATNGRTSYMNVRALNGKANGITDGNNDIVMFGHSAVGGNGSADVNGMGQGHGMQVGKAAGFFATTLNMWDSAPIRSTNCSSLYLFQRKMFSLMCSEFNGWMKIDGGTVGDVSGSWWRGGNVAGVVMAQFGACYVSDGILIDTTFPAKDPRMQANIGVSSMQSLSFFGMTHVRSDNTGLSGNFTVSGNTLTSNGHGLSNNQIVSLFTTATLPSPLTQLTQYYVINKTANTFQLSLTPSGSVITLTGAGSGTMSFTTFPTPFNAGGDMQANAGTAPAYLYDVSAQSMVNFVEPICSAPNVRNYYGLQTTFTVTIASPGVFTFGAAVVPVNGHRIVLATTGLLPTGLTFGTIYYVINASGQTCNLATSYGGTAIATTGSQSGVHSLVDYSSPFVNVRSNAQANYIVMDAYFNSIRMGGMGNNVHSKLMLGIAETDDSNPNYMIEMGDRLQPGSVPYRNALYGMWEFNNSPQYQDAVFNSGTTVAAGTKVVKAGILWQFLTTAGGGIASYTIQLPTDMNASQELVVMLVGGPITTLNFTLSGSGTFLANGITIFGTGGTTLVMGSPGFMTLKFVYRRDTNKWQLNAVHAGDNGGVLARTDGSNMQTGVVGHIVQSEIIQGGAVSLTTATTADITSVSLEPGQWIVSWAAKLRGVTGLTVTNFSAGVNTASITLAPTHPTQCGEMASNLTAVTGNVLTLDGANYKLNLTATTTVFLSAQATFSAGTCSAFGVITAELVG